MLSFLLFCGDTAWEGDSGPDELLFESIEPCPIDEHLTVGIVADNFGLVG